MSLADKPVYPVHNDEGACSLIDYNNEKKLQSGITYKQWLVGMLASNGDMLKAESGELLYNPNSIARNIIQQADAIIKELEKQ